MEQECLCCTAALNQLLITAFQTGCRACDHRHVLYMPTILASGISKWFQECLFESQYLPDNSWFRLKLFLCGVGSANKRMAAKDDT